MPKHFICADMLPGFVECPCRCTGDENAAISLRFGPSFCMFDNEQVQTLDSADMLLGEKFWILFFDWWKRIKNSSRVSKVDGKIVIGKRFRVVRGCVGGGQQIKLICTDSHSHVKCFLHTKLQL